MYSVFNGFKFKNKKTSDTLEKFKADVKHDSSLIKVVYNWLNYSVYMSIGLVVLWTFKYYVLTFKVGKFFNVNYKRN